MILKSWTKLYLPQWEPILGATTELERCCYQQSMLRLVASFCDLVSDLESTHKEIGKSTKDEVLIRRSVDLLVVGLINIGTIAPPPLRYDEIWGKIQKVFLAGAVPQNLFSLTNHCYRRLLIPDSKWRRLEM